MNPGRAGELAPVAILVRTTSDVERARWEARALARAVGLGAADVEAFTLAVIELATNLVRYADTGELTLSPLAAKSERARGVQVQSLDVGPGIADTKRALQDGYSTGGGLGGGLPAVRRLMDSFEIESEMGRGTRVVARKWPTKSGRRVRLRFGAATRPYPGETENGDGWRVDPLPGGGLRVAVVDGLGHGPPAAHATRLALDVLGTRLEADLEEALGACHQALIGSRGAAVTLADIYVRAGSLRYIGVGNVEGCVAWSNHLTSFLLYRGIVGERIRTVRAHAVALEPGWRLLVYTDGISSRVHPADLHDVADPQALADLVLERCARSSDDATVVVVVEA